jgi:hypothetical protein
VGYYVRYYIFVSFIQRWNTAAMAVPDAINGKVPHAFDPDDRPTYLEYSLL